MDGQKIKSLEFNFEAWTLIGVSPDYTPINPKARVSNAIPGKVYIPYEVGNTRKKNIYDLNSTLFEDYLDDLETIALTDKWPFDGMKVEASKNLLGQSINYDSTKDYHLLTYGFMVKLKGNNRRMHPVTLIYDQNKFHYIDEDANEIPIDPKDVLIVLASNEEGKGDIVPLSELIKKFSEEYEHLSEEEKTLKDMGKFYFDEEIKYGAKLHLLADKWRSKLFDEDQDVPVAKLMLEVVTEGRKELLQVLPVLFMPFISDDSFLYDPHLVDESLRVIPTISLPKVMNEYVDIYNAKLFFGCLYDGRTPKLNELVEASSYSNMKFKKFLVGLIELCKYFSVRQYLDFYQSMFDSVNWPKESMKQSPSPIRRSASPR